MYMKNFNAGPSIGEDKDKREYGSGKGKEGDPCEFLSDCDLGLVCGKKGKDKKGKCVKGYKMES